MLRDILYGRLKPLEVCFHKENIYKDSRIIKKTHKLHFFIGISPIEVTINISL